MILVFEWLFDHLVGLLSAIASIATLTVAIQTLRKTQQVYHATNSMKDELVKAARDAAMTAGILKGRALEKLDRDHPHDPR